MRGALLTIGLVGLLGGGCADAVPPRPPPFTPMKPVVPTTANDLVAPLAPAPPPDPNQFDPTTIKSIFADGRLAAVKIQVDNEAWPAAVTAMDAALASATDLAPSDRGTWQYELGRLRALAGDHANATKAFDECAASASPLASWGHFQAAEELVDQSQYDAALAELAQITDTKPMIFEMRRLQGDAHLGKRDVDQARADYDFYLGSLRHGSQWVTITLRLAGALLGKPTEAHAIEAFRLAHRVEVEGIGGQGAGNAKEVEKDALATLPFAKRKQLERSDDADKLEDAIALVGSQQSKEALRFTSALVKTKEAKKQDRTGCEIWSTHAEVLANLKKKADAAEAYTTAIDRCRESSQRPEILFRAGKALANQSRNVEAEKAFAAIEDEAPKNHLADDARLRRAKAALDGGDVAKFRLLLSTIDEDYPDGDVTSEGMFQLALQRIDDGDWADAMPILEAGVQREATDRTYWGAGRFAYYLARGHIAQGDAQRGDDELARIIGRHPLSFYMALASARLVEKDPELLVKAIHVATANESDGPFTVAKGAWTSDPAFARAVELARVGDSKSLRMELDAMGVSQRKAPMELTYVAAFLYNVAGDIRSSHGVLRSATNANSDRNEATQHLDHYPVGRWRAPWELMFPRPFLSVVDSETKKQGISEAFAYAIMREESAFDPHVASPAKAYGLMQLIVPTATTMGKALNLPGDEDSLKKPEINVALGCHYLAVLRSEFPDNPLLAIPGYNAGSGAPKKWLKDRPQEDFDRWVEKIPYEETRMYTKRVITSLAAYEFLYAPTTASEALRTPLAASPALRANALTPGSAPAKSVSSNEP